MTRPEIAQYYMIAAGGLGVFWLLLMGVFF